MSKMIYPYIPNSVPEIKKEMMAYVGVKDELELYEEIPDHLRVHGLLDLPEAITDEYSIKKHVEKILAKNKNCKDYVSFLGAGCAQHFTPAVCDEIAGRGEFLTCYGADTYSDRGKYQVFFEYQSMICMLTGMEFTTWPCNDGAQAAATALMMSNRLTGRRKVLLPASMNPSILSVIRNYLNSVQPGKRLEVQLVDYERESGMICLADLQQKLDDNVAAIYIENPSFLGVLEAHAVEIGLMARAAGAEYIVYADPFTLGVLEAPANYGATMVIGDFHSLGLHLDCGGAQAGFITVHDDMRYIWETKEQVFGLMETEEPEEYGFVRSLFDRTHYAIREKGKEFTGTQSNFWTFPTASYLALMGPKGMEEAGETSIVNAAYCAQRLTEATGFPLKFNAPFFQEFVLDLSTAGLTVQEINRRLLDYGVFGGYDLSREFPNLKGCMLICVTEIRTLEEIETFAHALRSILLGEG